MMPTLSPGDEVLVQKSAHSFQPGDLVLASHPYRTDIHILKRVEKIDERGHLELLGDCPQESTDSRTLGLFAPESIVGRVTSRL
jgi:nickel-type superoxide dismutase maturation protease